MSRPVLSGFFMNTLYPILRTQANGRDRLIYAARNLQKGTSMIFIRKVICATALVCCSIFAAQPGAEKPVTPVPVPREMLDGANLLIKTAGCSIALPGAGWAWMTYEKAGRNYLCLNSRTLEIYGVSVGELKGDILVAHQPESLIANEKKKVEGAGGKLRSEKWEFID